MCFLLDESKIYQVKSIYFMDSFRNFFENVNFVSEHEIVHMYRDLSIPVRKIGNTTNLSLGSIYRILKKHGINPNRRSTQHHEFIHHYIKCGMKAEEIAKLVGLSKRHVYNIKRKLGNSGN